MSKVINLVADIGGTNIRLGLVGQNTELSHIEKFECAKFDSLERILSHYIEKQNVQNCKINACLAIACPTENDEISMTNLPWKFSQSQLKASLNLNRLFLINDYTAIAHAIPLLTEEQKVQIGNGVAINKKPVSICGPGTGLGVANLVNVDENWHCLSGEGGHVDYAPVDQDEVKIMSFLLEVKQHRISYEQLLSGKGLEQIYQAIVSINALDKEPLSANEISTQAINNTCDICQQALEQFCKVLGSFAGNLALTLGSFGGVYIAGGIVPRFIEFFQQSGFRQRFEAKGRLSSFIQDIPTYVITESQPGLLGAAAYLAQQSSEELCPV